MKNIQRYKYFALILAFLSGLCLSQSNFQTYTISNSFGDVSVQIPANWLTIEEAPADQGGWYLGDEDFPEAGFAVVLDSEEYILEGFALPEYTLEDQVDMNISGYAASKYVLLDNDEGIRYWIIVIKQTGADGMNLIFYSGSPLSAWPQYEATFFSIIQSVQIGPSSYIPPDTVNSGQAQSFSCEQDGFDLSFDAAPGDSFVITCPANCSSDYGFIWGTDIYTNDSSVCLAAIHAGVLTTTGGQVLVTVLDGQTNYEASTRNGVESAAYGEWDTSFWVSAIGGVVDPTPQAAEILVDSTVLTPGQIITANYSGASGNARDWIGIYKQSASDREFISWQYLNSNQNGSLSFNAPSEVASYNFRMFQDDGFTLLATSQTFEVRATTPASQPTTISTPAQAFTCQQEARELTDGTNFIITCPANCTSGRLWGTDIYTNDSSVCVAAVHSGAISTSGGQVQVTILPGQESYLGSSRNGVDSKSYGSWGGSFRVAASSNVATPTTPQQATSQATANLTVKSNIGGFLSNNSGASLQIPTGAVPLTEDGSIGEMVFSIEESRAEYPSLPTDFERTGSVYIFGPEGFTFTAPVLISLTVPPDVDIDTVVGLSYFDAESNSWKLKQGTVDKQSHTVSVSTSHFSPWTISRFRQGTDSNSWNAWKQKAGATVHVKGGMRSNYRFPESKRLPVAQSYGFCVNSVTYTNPADANNWFGNQLRQQNLSTYHSPGDFSREQLVDADVFLVAGRYQISEIYHFSEYGNRDPFYVPFYKSYWRTTTLVVNPGQDIEFYGQDVVNVDFTGWQQGQPECWGALGKKSLTSVHTGDVQVTLTWSGDADIDIYVTDPAGDTIFYNNMGPIASGGELDRDNRCEDDVMGGPENIFWPKGTAPKGKYKVEVRYYDSSTDTYTCKNVGTINWSVRVVIAGSSTTYRGTLSSLGESKAVTEFEIP